MLGNLLFDSYSFQHPCITYKIQKTKVEFGVIIPKPPLSPYCCIQAAFRLETLSLRAFINSIQPLRCRLIQVCLWLQAYTGHLQQGKHRWADWSDWAGQGAHLATSQLADATAALRMQAAHRAP